MSESAPYRSQAYEEKSDSGCKECISQVADGPRLLIQSENVQVAIQKSREHIPVILKEEVNTLVERLDVEPESSDPYHRFLDCLNLPEINAAMGMLYAVSIGNSAIAEVRLMS
mgnify:FL=1